MPRRRTLPPLLEVPLLRRGRPCGSATPSAGRGLVQNEAEGAAPACAVRRESPAIQGEDVDRIKKSTEDVEHAFHALSQQMYAQSSQDAAGPQTSSNGHTPGPDEGEDEGEVVEGEFREA